jgi:predicted phosphoribosyltransferase
LEVKEKNVLLVDDGIATGATIEVAIRALKAARPRSISIAVPIASLRSVERLHRYVDHIFALQTPVQMEAIGDFYESFPQLSDEQALRLLEQGLERINVTYNS